MQFYEKDKEFKESLKELILRQDENILQQIEKLVVKNVQIKNRIYGLLWDSLKEINFNQKVCQNVQIFDVISIQFIKKVDLNFLVQFLYNSSDDQIMHLKTLKFLSEVQKYNPNHYIQYTILDQINQSCNLKNLDQLDQLEFCHSHLDIIMQIIMEQNLDCHQNIVIIVEIINQQIKQLTKVFVRVLFLNNQPLNQSFLQQQKKQLEISIFSKIIQIILNLMLFDNLNLDLLKSNIYKIIKIWTSINKNKYEFNNSQIANIKTSKMFYILLNKISQIVILDNDENLITYYHLLLKISYKKYIDFQDILNQFLKQIKNTELVIDYLITDNQFVELFVQLLQNISLITKSQHIQFFQKLYNKLDQYQNSFPYNVKPLMNKIQNIVELNFKSNDKK